MKKTSSMRSSALFFAACVFLQSFLPVMVSARNQRVQTYHPFFVPTAASAAIPEIRSAEKAIGKEAMPKIVAAKPLPGGPDQPEVKSFTPIGTSDMVNPFTGDFSYNIPLLEIDGYPVNIAYNAGVTMDQEASWVGLGWNLNPGVVNRVMRGLPDDFNGTDQIAKEMNMKRNFTIGTSAAENIELFGIDALSGLSITPKLGINYNNYNGFGAEISIMPSFSTGVGSKSELNIGLGISGSSDGGASVSPNISFSKRTEGAYNDNNERTAVTKGISIGSSFNSRAGVKAISMEYSKHSDIYVLHGPRPADGGLDKANESKKGSGGRSVTSSFNPGMSTFVPQISMPMNSAGGTFSFKLGIDLIGFDPNFTFSGYYSAQWLKDKTKSVPAYGYLNLQNGQYNQDAMLDFNRENDGAFTKNTPALPVPSLTYDLFNVSGQGVSGSYRAHRPDIGYVFDPYAATNGVDGSLGLEVGAGGTFKAGIDISATYSNSQSGVWDNSNGASDKLGFTASYIPFIEANEMSVTNDPGHFDRIGAGKAVRFNNQNFESLENIMELDNNTHLETQTNYRKSGVEKRNQVISTVNHKELKDGLGIEPIHPSAYNPSGTAIDHHIAQFTTLNTDGTRYIYGIAAYNISETDLSFAIGSGRSSDGLLPDDYLKGQVTYSDNDASTRNSRGLDNYYNSVTTPAYAHSYLLTSVLNPDYIDIDNIKGPSANDLGGYIKFSYQKVGGYLWRNPVEDHQAAYDEGLNTNLTDDKAHLSYGEKELWYVNKIETKNHVAIFYTSGRNDGSNLEHIRDGMVSSSTDKMQVLDSIRLYSLPEYNANPTTAVPLKTVHFEYDYSLCKDYPLNVTGEKGKLTLKKLYFTYQNSHKGRYTPYEFGYGNNPKYSLKSSDRWGTYKPKPTSWSDVANDPLRPSDFPYTGFVKDSVDLYASAWCLDTIHLPSGGRIVVDYESDDYAYVQHKRANQMLRIVGVENPGSDPYDSGTHGVSDDTTPNPKIYFELVPGYNEINDYLDGIDKVYFRALTNFGEGYDFVPGYGDIDITNCGIDTTLHMGYLKFKPGKLKDNGPSDYNPIAVTGIQFGRLYLSPSLPPSNIASVDENSPAGDLAGALIGAFKSFGELFTGPNVPLYNDQLGTQIVIGNSWVRLNNPDFKKLGGGHRVKQIRMYDGWGDMMDDAGKEFYYGQNYSYTLTDGKSSGVAAYEPQMGGDENAWRQPLANDTKFLLAPDTRNYQELPFGEQFFPGAMVGYSRVKVSNLKHAGVIRTATGSVVHEFYTSKDFPTITHRTSPQIERLKLPVFAFFFSLSIDEMTASQGFVVENNDMNGKPKSQSVYSEGDTLTPISSVSYFFQQESMNLDGVQASHLTSNVTVIEKNGTTSTKTVGLVYEAVADFRKSNSKTVSGTIGGNINFTIPFILIPSISGSGSLEHTSFKSATFTKVIERFGIMTNTIAKDLGSTVETNDLAYDAETGVPLLTQTTTDFNDKVYNFTYPAHWYYDGMGQAYKNMDLTIDATSSLFTFTAGVTSNLNKNSGLFLGDEVVVYDIFGSTVFCWVTEMTDNSLKLLQKNGLTIPNGFNYSKLKVIRSGRRNMQTTPVASLVLRANPLTNLTGNVFGMVLQAGAVEYNDQGRTFCECYSGDQPIVSANPFVLGTKGNWRPKASYTYLSERTQALQNNNSNIRRDGVFASFTPFYKLVGGLWAMDKQSWTYASSVVEFSPTGQPLETVDALNRYSSSQYGYNQTLATAVAANTRYEQLAFDNFEDYGFASCIDKHFKLPAATQVVNTQSHSGHNSVRVTTSTPVIYAAVMEVNCEAACTLDIAFSDSTSTSGDNTIHHTAFEATGGTAPFSIEYSDAVNVSKLTLNDDGSMLTLDGTNTWRITIILTDDKGCKVIKHYPGGE